MASGPPEMKLAARRAKAAKQKRYKVFENLI
jgi:hypothetical protein